MTTEWDWTSMDDGVAGLRRARACATDPNSMTTGFRTDSDVFDDDWIVMDDRPGQPTRIR